MPDEKYVTKSDLSEWHEQKVAPSLSKLDKLYDALMGDPLDDQKPGLVGKVRDHSNWIAEKKGEEGAGKWRMFVKESARMVASAVTGFFGGKVS